MVTFDNCSFAVIRSAPFIAIEAFRSVTSSTILPSLDEVSTMSPAKLESLRVVRVTKEMKGGYYLAKFGLIANDGKISAKFDAPVDLPLNIHTVKTVFTKNELYIHSIRFEGDTVLSIGRDDEQSIQKKEYEMSRIETFKLGTHETLLGVELFNDQRGTTVGVRWMALHRAASGSQIRMH